jgi:hypothetical protein
VKAYLIDPFQRKLHDLEVGHDLGEWYRALRCDCVDVVHVGQASNGHAVDIWVDDEGLLRSEPWPLFKIGRSTLAGYGLVLESDNQGQSRGVTFPKSYFNGRIFFESWEQRLDPAKYLDEMTRVPSWEHV